MYRFLRCQPHPKCPDLQGWYLEVCPDDTETVCELHCGVCHFYYIKFGMDPHLKRHLKPDSEEGILKNPIRLAAKWLQSVEHFLLRGEAVLVNSNGGLMPRDGAIVLATVENDKMQWPEHWDDEVITISRWSEARHYYLASNKDRVFVPPKYVRYDDARHEALRYTPADRIKSKE